MKRLPKHHRLILLLTIALSVLASPASAQQWDELSDAERAVLAPWESQWSGLAQEQRTRLLEGAERWQTMTPAERDEVRRRLQAWEAMTPEERASVRSRMERFSEMPEAQRRRVREGMERLRQLPPDQRRELRRRWNEMSRDERRAFLDGLAVGERLRQRDWMAALEPEQRETLREIADGLDRVQRWALTAKIRRLPDTQSRADFARRLIEADPEAREEMIAAAEGELRERR